MNGGALLYGRSFEDREIQNLHNFYLGYSLGYLMSMNKVAFIFVKFI